MVRRESSHARLPASCFPPGTVERKTLIGVCTTSSDECNLSQGPQMSAQAAQFDNPMSRAYYRDTNVAPSRVEDRGDQVQNNAGLAAEGQVRVGAQASSFELPENIGLIDPLLVEGHLGFPPGLMIDDPASRAFIPIFF